MTARRTRTLLELVVLVVIWVGLWADLSVANVVSGVLVAGGVLALFGWSAASRDAPLVVRPLRIAVFALWFLWQLVKSNIAVARLVVSPRPALDPGIVAYRLHTASPGVATLVANAITLTPGTLTVTVDRDPPTLFVHCVQVGDLAATMASLAELELQVLRAFAPAHEIEAAAADLAARTHHPSATGTGTGTGTEEAG
jgi:multicomponent Na+:H+ antiporter subunit E